jgi:hypothetical protein
MKLTRLSAAHGWFREYLAEGAASCPRWRETAGTASQLIASVGPTHGGMWRTSAVSTGASLATRQCERRACPSPGWQAAPAGTRSPEREVARVPCDAHGLTASGVGCRMYGASGKVGSRTQLRSAVAFVARRAHGAGHERSRRSNVRPNRRMKQTRLSAAPGWLYPYQTRGAASCPRRRGTAGTASQLIRGVRRT